MQAAYQSTVNWKMWCQDPDLNEYLLTCAPYLRRYHEICTELHCPQDHVATPPDPCHITPRQYALLQACVQLHREFLDATAQTQHASTCELPSEQEIPLRHQLVSTACAKPTPTLHCQHCREISMVLCHENRQYICSQCGTIQTDRLRDSWSDLSGAHREQYSRGIRYQYSRSKYIRRLLTNLRGDTCPPRPRQTLQHIRNYAHAHHIRVHRLTPASLLLLLRDMKRPQWYAYRWYLCRELNSEYHPPPIDDHFVDRILSIFQQCVPRFFRYESSRQSFYHYPTFLRLVCQREGRDDIAQQLPPLKNDAQRQAQEACIDKLLNQIY